MEGATSRDRGQSRAGQPGGEVGGGNDEGPPPPGAGARPAGVLSCPSVCVFRSSRADRPSDGAALDLGPYVHDASMPTRGGVRSRVSHCDTGNAVDITPSPQVVSRQTRWSEA